MKKLLIASTALLATTAMASADMSLTGDGRMGVISAQEDTSTAAVKESTPQFTSRIRATFTGSGQTDAGLAFGGSFRADNAAGAAAGTAGSVFAEYSGMRVTMGDTSGAAESVVGDLNEVGLTGLGGMNEVGYLANAAANRPTARFDYTIGDFVVSASASNPSTDVPTGQTVASAGVKYTIGDLVMAVGTEQSSGVGNDSYFTVASVAYDFGDVTLKGIYGSGGTRTVSTRTTAGVGMAYTFDAITIDAFYRQNRTTLTGAAADTNTAGGIGVTYDLGGGAALEGGWVTETDTDATNTTKGSAYDFGIKFTF